MPGAGDILTVTSTISPTFTFDAEKTMLLAVGFFICPLRGMAIAEIKRTRKDVIFMNLLQKNEI
jgi:hypothetical protein